MYKDTRYARSPVAIGYRARGYRNYQTKVLDTTIPAYAARYPIPLLFHNGGVSSLASLPYPPPFPPVPCLSLSPPSPTCLGSHYTDDPDATCVIV